MSAIQNFLDYLLHAEFGKDVRQGIHDSIKQCYDDATGNPESVAAVVEQNDKMKELLENTPYTTVESEGEFELPVHTINDSKISDDSTWSSKKIIDAIYPVGAIYMSVNNVNPSELLGGTWVAWGAGRVPVGVDRDDIRFWTPDLEGGEYEVELTIDHMPQHYHEITGTYEQTGGSAHPNSFSYGLLTGSSNNGRTVAAGGNVPHNNLQPYITCYMWKRAA